MIFVAILLLLISGTIAVREGCLWCSLVSFTTAIAIAVSTGITYAGHWLGLW